MAELNINGLEEITNFIGTRTEIYNLIAKNNPLAIVNYKEAYVKVEDEGYLIILKKVGTKYQIRIIWRLRDNKQFNF